MKMKRVLAGMLSACLMILAPQIAIAADMPRGDGTAASPYMIQSAAQLLDLATRKYDRDLSKNYILTDSISLSGMSWTPIGDERVPFRGVFNGNGHSITGLSFSGGSRMMGLFGYNSGTIEKLQVSGSVSGTDTTGILAGFNTGQIIQCWATGAVSGSGYSVGALVGQSSGYISECAAGDADVTSVDANAGGLIGMMTAGKVENCYSTANVSISGTNPIAGGLIGVLSGGSVWYCYAAGRVSPASPNVNGLIGRVDASATGGADYFDANATGCVDPVGIALTTPQAKSAASYAGWDFNGIWDVYPTVNYGYPNLRNNPALIETVVISKAAAPAASPPGGNVAYGTKVALTTSTPGANIYYTTDGSTPTVNSSVYSQPITITDNMTIQAFAAASGYQNSDIIRFIYNIGANVKTAAPRSNLTSAVVPYGTSLVLSSGTAGAVIYYTTDGSSPSIVSKKYTGPITLISDITIKAYAAAPGQIDSDTVVFVFRIQGVSQTGDPVASINSSAVSYGTAVTLSSITSGARIYYTTDGSAPNAHSTLYTAPIIITKAVTIKAIAISPNIPDSNIVTYNYTLMQNNPPQYAMTVSLQIGNKQYTKNGTVAYFDVAPYIEPSSNRTMVPIRFIAEALGASVSWDNATTTDTISLFDKTLKIVLNQQLPNNMGASMLINDRLFVPIRYVSEQLGAKVDWDDTSKTVYITK